MVWEESIGLEIKGKLLVAGMICVGENTSNDKADNNACNDTDAEDHSNDLGERPI
jgi:hypothetical protein